MSRGRRNGYLLMGEAHTDTHWQVADPTDEGYRDALRALHRAEVDADGMARVSRKDIVRVLALAHSYVHHATCPLGTEYVVKQLRAIRRALKRGAR